MSSRHSLTQHPHTVDAQRLSLRLGAQRFSPGLWGWVLPLAIAAVALVLRLRGLGNPHKLVFDETYYAKDAYSLLQVGYELTWPEEADDLWLAGEPQPGDEGSYVVHPPLGKWLIAIGIRLFGVDSALGWRFSSAVAGALGVLLVALIAQRMFRSVFLGAFAGTLTAVEGHHLVMSRMAMLDIFLMLFVLAAFGALLMDRYSSRRRLVTWATEIEPKSSAWRWGPAMWWRPWQLAAAVLLGAATSVKLSALAFFAVFGLLVVFWEIEARRTLGIRRWLASGLLRAGVPAAVTVLPVALVVYITSWSGWLASSDGWGRQWHVENPASGVGSLVPDGLRSLAQYHVNMTQFHQGLDSGHDYASSPWTWLFMGRPVSIHFESLEAGEVYSSTQEVCEEPSCASAIVDLANPLLWWVAAIALAVTLVLWLGRRDRRAGAILTGYLAGYAVWLLFPDRTMFFFYTIAFHPFVILAVTLVAAKVLTIGTTAYTRAGTARTQAATVSATQRNTVIVLCFLLLVVSVSIFFWPVWTAELVPYEQWQLRMWLQSWI